MTKDIQVFVKPLTGGTYVIKPKEIDTVQILLNRIEEREGIPDMRITFESKNLSEHKTKCLRQMGIVNASTIHILGRLKGG